MKEDKEEKHSSKNSSTESLTERSKDKKKTSPFKFLQDNIVEKMKKIPKPNEIKEKIQEKISRDSQSEPNSSRYSQEYVFETEDMCSDDKQAVTSSSNLPPVIKLDSPDLISIEVAIEAIKLSDKANMKKIPSVEQFAAAVGEQNNESEIELSDQSANKTCSGAHSALRKLQDEHHEEENSDTVLSRKSFSEDSVELVTSSELSQEKKTDADSERGSVPSENLNKVNIIPEEEGLVFSRKMKPKGKKKKKGKLTH